MDPGSGSSDAAVNVSAGEAGAVLPAAATAAAAAGAVGVLALNGMRLALRCREAASLATAVSAGMAPVRLREGT